MYREDILENFGGAQYGEIYRIGVLNSVLGVRKFHFPNINKKNCTFRTLFIFFVF